MVMSLGKAGPAVGRLVERRHSLSPHSLSLHLPASYPTQPSTAMEPNFLTFWIRTHTLKKNNPANFKAANSKFGFTLKKPLYQLLMETYILP